MSDLFPDLFDKFWQAYPRKVGKKNAIKAFGKLPEPAQRAAIADVEKRNRMRAWSGNKRLVPHAATYLNGERWEDDWQAEMRVEDDTKPNSGPYVPPQPKVPEREYTLVEVLINRAFRDYLLIAGGLGDADRVRTDEEYARDCIKPALAEKRDILTNYAPAYAEDVAAGITDKGRAAVELVDLFLARMDAAYGRSLRDTVWRHMRAAHGKG